MHFRHLWDVPSLEVLRATWWGFGQPDLVGRVPAHGRGLEPEGLCGPFQPKPFPVHQSWVFLLFSQGQSHPHPPTHTSLCLSHLGMVTLGLAGLFASADGRGHIRNKAPPAFSIPHTDFGGAGAGAAEDTRHFSGLQELLHGEHIIA